MAVRRKRRSDFGSLNEVARDKKYVYRWTDERSRRHSRTWRCTYAEAKERAERIRAEVTAAKESRQGRAMTIGQIWNAWVLPSYERRFEAGMVKAKTMQMYKRVWSADIAPRWADVPADEVRPADVQAWLDAGNSTRRTALNVLKQIGKACVTYEITPDNKFSRPYNLPSAAKPHSKDILSASEAASLANALHGHPIEAAYILMAFGSCRVGESLGVRAAEVAPLECDGLTFATAPIIRRMPQTGDLPLPDGDLKTTESERTVCVPPPWSTRLLDIAAKRIDDGREWLSDRGDGLPPSTSRALTMWVKLSISVAMQNLRPSWRTMAQMEWGIDSDTLELMMGHRLPGTTGQHYMRPAPHLVAVNFAKQFAAREAALDK